MTSSLLVVPGHHKAVSMAANGPEALDLDVKERRVAAGLCRDCGKKPVRRKRQHCVTCSIRRNESLKVLIRKSKNVKRTRDHERCTTCRQPGHDKRTCDIFGPSAIVTKNRRKR